MSLAFENLRPAVAAAGAARWFGFGLRASLIGANLLGAVVLAGTLLTNRVNDHPAFTPENRTEGGLASVDMAVALIEREVVNTAWVPNEPFFTPGHWLPQMQAYQQGLMYGLSRYAFELADTLGRARGATAVDPDLDRAAGLLRFPGDVWIFDLEKTWAPTVTSEEQYRSAARALAKYNERVASGAAIFDTRVDNLAALLIRLEADISSQINVLAEHVERVAAGEAVESNTNEIFYTIKGRLYAYLMILNAVGEDFSSVIEMNGADLVWSRMLESLQNAAVMQPFIVFNGPPGSMMAPNHLAELGFFALRAKTQMRDAIAVLTA